MFAEVRTVTMSDTVSFHNFYELFDEHGELHQPDAPNAAATTMLDELVWWGRALRDARAGDRERNYAA